jgi:hypothetical protein
MRKEPKKSVRRYLKWLHGKKGGSAQRQGDPLDMAKGAA